MRIFLQASEGFSYAVLGFKDYIGFKRVYKSALPGKSEFFGKVAAQAGYGGVERHSESFPGSCCDSRRRRTIIVCGAVLGVALKIN